MRAGAVGHPSVRLVVPYFGRRPAYLPLVLRSMARNPDVHWLLVTDEPVPGAPPNVAVQRCTFEALAARLQRHWDLPLALRAPYKLCDFRPAFGEVFAEELAGYDFWGHSDLDVVFGRLRDHLPPDAFDADKVLVSGNLALYRNTPEAAGWYRHEVAGVSYREVFTTPAAMHFDEWAGIYRIIRRLGVPTWHEEVVFDLSLDSYRTRSHPPKGGTEPRRYAWEEGEVAEYRLRGGEVERRTGLLVHLQKRRMRAPSAQVLQAGRYWVGPDAFAVQRGVSAWQVRAARVPTGRDLLPFHWRRLQRLRGRRAARRAGRDV